MSLTTDGHGFTRIRSHLNHRGTETQRAVSRIQNEEEDENEDEDDFPTAGTHFTEGNGRKEFAG